MFRTVCRKVAIFLCNISSANCRLHDLCFCVSFVSLLCLFSASQHHCCSALEQESKGPPHTWLAVFIHCMEIVGVFASCSAGHWILFSYIRTERLLLMYKLIFWCNREVISQESFEDCYDFGRQLDLLCLTHEMFSLIFSFFTGCLLRTARQFETCSSW